MKIKSIRAAGTADVYNMEVEDTHDFAVGSGVIVHNCYDQLRYICMKNPLPPRPRKAPPLVVYDPLDLNTPQYDKYEFYRRY